MPRPLGGVIYFLLPMIPGIIINIYRLYNKLIHNSVPKGTYRGLRTF